jgi:O-antigen ligase
MRYEIVQTTRSETQFRFSKSGVWLFWAASAYLFIPLVDFPMLGVSLSAFMLLLVGWELFLGENVLHFRQLAHWGMLVYWLWLGFQFSIVGNVLLGEFDLTSAEFTAVAQITFWLMTFYTVIHLVAQIPSEHLRTAVIVMGCATIALGLLRLYEGFILGRLGSRGVSIILTQNEYGLIFSRGTPFAIALPFLVSKIELRSLSVVGLLVLITAIAVNGSRSSWLGVGVSLLVFALLYVRANPDRFQITLIFIVIFALISVFVLLTLVPSAATDSVLINVETLENVEDDRSWAVRQLMIHKAIKLFEDNPLWGAGFRRFKTLDVDLEIPEMLSNIRRNPNRIAPHNSYASLLAETGLMGTIPFAIIMLLLIFHGWQAVGLLSARESVWPIAIYVSFIGMGIHMWNIDNLNNTATWFIYGLVAGMIERTRTNS